jgi:hypothetical protein
MLDAEFEGARAAVQPGEAQDFQIGDLRAGRDRVGQDRLRDERQESASGDVICP